MGKVWKGDEKRVKEGGRHIWGMVCVAMMRSCTSGDHIRVMMIYVQDLCAGDPVQLQDPVTKTVCVQGTCCDDVSCTGDP